MATAKFKTSSPYTQAKQTAHHSDFRHEQYLVNAGLSRRKVRHDVEVASDLQVINVALFALGRAGSIHLGNIMKNPRLNLKYLVEPCLEKLERVGKEWRLPPSALLTPGQQDLVFQDEELHGVVIATPTHLHRELVTKALTAGKAVLCEKPIAEEMESTKHCYEIAQKTGKPLICAFNRRFDPSFCQLQKEVREGAVGQVHLVKTVARDSPLPSIEYLKQSGGIFHDCAVHDIDLICWVMGEYPVEVYAAASSFIPEVRDIDDHDTVAFTMRFASGALSTTDLSRNAVYGYDQRLEAFGPKGMLSAHNERPYQIRRATEAGETEPPILHSFPSRYYEGYVRELDHFCDVVQGLDDNMLSGENTLRVSIIASALEESVKTGQAVKVTY